MHSLEKHFTAVAVTAGHLTLEARFYVPPDAEGVVVFASGDGSTAQSPRNFRVIDALHDVGLATLWFNVMPEAIEAADGFNARIRNDASMLSERVHAATRWVRRQAEFSELPIGCFGTSHAAAAALVDAARADTEIQVVATRGGRPDLAPALAKVRVPTMLIVGGNDGAAALNLEAWARLRCERAIEIIPGAGHRFEEPGALDNLAALAARWFSEHLRRPANVAA
jgi:putative phosphoribosyl transferase